MIILDNGLLVVGMMPFLDDSKPLRFKTITLPIVTILIVIKITNLNILLRDFYLTQFDLLPLVIFLFTFNVIVITVYLILYYLNLKLLEDKLDKLEGDKVVSLASLSGKERLITLLIHGVPRVLLDLV